jgi:hypothetical protein
MKEDERKRDASRKKTDASRKKTAQRGFNYKASGLIL